MDSSDAPPLKAGLYVVATPIGNLGDVSARSLSVLRTAAVIAAEDTRVARRLLELSDASSAARLVSLTEHNTEQRIPILMAAAREGAVALVSDAGTPVIADPGARVVAAAHAEGIPVFAVPGPSALAAAVSIAGFSGDDLHFLGFLPRQAAARRTRLSEAARAASVLVFFESPQRLSAALDDVAAALDDPETVVCRELTKVYEEAVRGHASELAGHFAQTRGECTVVVAVPDEPAGGETDTGAARDLIRLLKQAGGKRSLSAGIVAARHGLGRAEAYALWDEVDD